MSLNYEKFLVRSEDRIASDTPSDYSIFFTNELYRYNSIRISQIMVPYSTYSINSNNNVIVFNEGGGDLLATISSGNYTATELIAEIKLRMDAVGGTYTVTYDSVTNKITAAVGAGTFYFVLSSASFTANNLLGYIDVSTDTAAAASQTSATGINLSGTSYYRLVISDLDVDFISGYINNNTRYSAIFPLTASGYNQTMIYNFQEIKHLTIVEDSIRTFKKIRIQWFDDQNNLLEMNGQQNWLEVEINFKKYII